MKHRLKLTHAGDYYYRFTCCGCGEYVYCNKLVLKHMIAGGYFKHKLLLSFESFNKHCPGGNN